MNNAINLDGIRIVQIHTQDRAKALGGAEDRRIYRELLAELQRAGGLLARDPGSNSELICFLDMPGCEGGLVVSLEVWPAQDAPITTDVHDRTYTQIKRWLEARGVTLAENANTFNRDLEA